MGVRGLAWEATPALGRLKVGRAPPYGQAGMLAPTIIASPFRVEETPGHGANLFEEFEDSVFDGEYITGDVDQHYLDRIHELRNDANLSRHAGIHDDGDSSVM